MISLLNTATAQGKMVLTMLAAVAEMERTLMLERQAVGVAKAKAEGKYKGRPALSESVTARVLELKATTGLRKALKLKSVSTCSNPFYCC